MLSKKHSVEEKMAKGKEHDLARTKHT